ncbi:amidohydrolase family protein [Actinoallomurus rhizosphaericola]|uniref:amidohydrolase family protein n=1 Tax=Actinoallomurus rhizosphaericola TaxID=2952536 RepID=UPI002090C69D|nr:amidohydrolase family protein [Actinoallomurus rhizosphaericola]MCO5994135.1 amidohydrolase [Actinoallomurus rhizosphaericola]
MSEQPYIEGLVDVHAHFVTDEYVAAAKAAGHLLPDGMPGWPRWDAGTHLELMDEWGVATSILSISSPGTHFGDDRAARALCREVNDAGAGVAREHPGRFGHFASLPLPDVEGALAEASRALDELSSWGVAVVTSAGGRYLGAPEYEPLWAELNRRRAVVFVHPTSPCCGEALSAGRPRPMMEFIFDSARAAADLVFSGVLARHPDIRWIFTHGGGSLPLLADRMELFRTVFRGGPGDAPTVQEQLAGLWWDMAGTPFPRQIPALVDAFGSRRVLYGSDYCWTPAVGAAAQVASIDEAEQPPGTTWRALTTRNASRLFPALSTGENARRP